MNWTEQFSWLNPKLELFMVSTKGNWPLYSYVFHQPQYIIVCHRKDSTRSSFPSRLFIDKEIHFDYENDILSAVKLNFDISAMLNPLEVTKVSFYLSGMTSRPLCWNLSIIVKHNVDKETGNEKFKKRRIDMKRLAIIS